MNRDTTKSVTIPFGTASLELRLPAETDVLKMPAPPALSDPGAAVQEALHNPIGSEALSHIATAKVKSQGDPTAVIVISDHTRPVPYKGEQGVLWPIVEILRDAGIAEDNITVLVGTGTHHPLKDEIEDMLDERVLRSRVKIVSHDCRNEEMLRYVGTTGRGTEAYLNRLYLDADLKITTGLVESHFLAGASGGRKAICPGIVGEQTTYSFHSAAMIASPDSRNLKVEGNPHHEEALEVARMAGVDFTVNVTLDNDYNVTGVYAGELEAAHRGAVEHISSYVTIPMEHDYDIVLTHGGFVSINHYQAVKSALVAAEALSESGWLVLAAANTDIDPIGSTRYRTLLHLMKMIGPDAFNRVIFSEDWSFVPDQWEVQAWAKVIAQASPDRFVYYSPQCSAADYEIIPGVDGNTLLPDKQRYTNDPANVQRVMDAAIERGRREPARSGPTNTGNGSVAEPQIAFLYDGPYGILTKS